MTQYLLPLLMMLSSITASANIFNPETELIGTYEVVLADGFTRDQLIITAAENGALEGHWDILETSWTFKLEKGTYKKLEDGTYQVDFEMVDPATNNMRITTTGIYHPQRRLLIWKFTAPQEMSKSYGTGRKL